MPPEEQKPLMRWQEDVRAILEDTEGTAKDSENVGAVRR